MIILIALFLLSLWCGAVGPAVLFAIFICLAMPSTLALSHEAVTMKRWHKRNRGT